MQASVPLELRSLNLKVSQERHAAAVQIYPTASNRTRSKITLLLYAPARTFNSSAKKLQAQYILILDTWNLDAVRR